MTTSHRRGNAAKSHRRKVLGRVAEVAITGLGGRGDGVGMLDGKPVFVPYTVTGDRVLASIEGRRGEGLAASLVQVVTPSPQRVPAVCGHFGDCGGCSVQHVAPAAYTAWKRDLVAAALARQGLGDVPVGALVQVPPGQRRRATFAFARTAAGIVVGFHARATHRIVAVQECPAADPRLVALLAPLHSVLSEVLDKPASGNIAVTLADGGLDVVIECAARLSLAHREALVAFAETADLTRLSWRQPGEAAEPVVQRRPAVVVFGRVPVELPAGAFLQPSDAGERAIVDLVTAAIGDSDPVCDLFAGCGTLTLPLARQSAVHAVEGEGAALSALRAAADRAGLRVSTEARDLVRRPLQPSELRRFAALVFDPPRTGAAEQAAALAAGGPPLVVGVSCHPASFAHDARLLVGGGYRLEAVTPIDQFPWAAHVEMVGVFRRP